MKRIVVDASVVLKWYLDDEDHGQKAVHLLTGYISGEFDMIAPSLLEYEVINGLMVARKKGRIDEEKIFSAIEGFINLGIKQKNLAHLYPKLFYYGKTYHCTAYDASYIATADDEGILLITADRGLFNMAGKDLKWIKWIGDI
ncbi:MAG: hypothetical protein B6D35_14170 [Candidatus Brocadia sp. UTAMX2]|jgi:predicted nucleic acid-binding protein|nr:MAG: hypothetical protein B6D35_14170 [Candidatus Brocadia sp. UTAMX2]